MSRIISYRGLLADGGQDTINLHTNDGKTGYKVVKFEIMPQDPGNNDTENIVKIYKLLQTAATATIDFSDITLIAAGFFLSGSATTRTYGTSVIFDNEIFNQDIYVTNVETTAAGSANYYIELEQIDLTEDQALVAIVKNLRNEQ